MEYVELLSILKEKYLKILQFIVAFVLLFLVLFFLTPETYITEGTLYIYPINNFKQQQEVSSDMNFARNIIGVSESPEFKRNISKLDVSFIPFVGVSVGYKLKEVTPNLVSITVKDYTFDSSKNKYSEYVDNLVTFSNNLKKGNANFAIENLESDPVTYKVSKNIYLNIFIGFVLGLFFGITYFYLKKGKN